jgi:hypothetical protein
MMMVMPTQLLETKMSDIAGFVNPFAAVDVASIPDDPFLVPAATYDTTVTRAEIKPTKDEKKMGFNLTYSDLESSRKITEWYEIPTGYDEAEATEAQTRQMVFLKRTLTQLGLTVDEIKTGNWQDLLEGRNVYVKVTHRKQKNRENPTESTIVSQVSERTWADAA